MSKAPETAYEALAEMQRLRAVIDEALDAIGRLHEQLAHLPLERCADEAMRERALRAEGMARANRGA